LSWRPPRGSALQKRLRDREKEAELDERDRKREKEEHEEIRQRLLAEGHPDPDAELQRVSPAASGAPQVEQVERVDGSIPGSCWAKEVRVSGCKGLTHSGIYLKIQWDEVDALLYPCVAVLKVQYCTTRCEWD
jgi:hypothetical protein